MPSSFPTKREALNSYLSTAVKYLNLHAVRLSINPAKLAELTSLYGDTTTPGTYMFYFLRWADAGGGRTKNVIGNLTILETKIKKLLAAIYNDIPESVWNEDDRSTFKRKIGLPRHTVHHATDITEQCLFQFIAIGGGDVKLKFRALHDSSRPSKPKGADAVELAMRIDEPYERPDPHDNSRVKRVPLAHHDDGTTRHICTRASFLLRLGSENSGNYLQLYARWINTKHPLLAGPWTGPFSLIIS